MSQDIRSFFSVASKKKVAVNGNHQSKTNPNLTPPTLIKRKALVISSDEEDNVQNQQESKRPKQLPSTSPSSSDKGKYTISKKRLHIIDSDENDDIDSITNSFQKKQNLHKTTQLTQPLKNVSIEDAFGSAPIKRVDRPKIEKKLNQTLTKAEIESHFNDDEEDFVVVDESILNGSIVIEKGQKSKSETIDVKKSPIKMDVSTNDEIIAGTPEVKRVSKVKTPKAKEFNLSDSQQDEDRHERKRMTAMLYQKFKSRGGATNPGSKEIPEGKPNCLRNMTFVLSGIYESLEREDASDLIKKYGGRVTTSLSKKTNYMVAGEDAGLAKMAKADELKIAILSEDDFLNLIRKFSGIPLAASTTTKNGFDEKKPKKKSPKKEETTVTVKSPIKKESPVKADVKIPAVKIEPSTSVKLSPKKVKVELGEKMKDLKIDRPITEYQKDIASVSNQAWVEKYKPMKTKDIIGQQGAASNCFKLQNWLSKWHSNHDGKKKLQRPNPWAKNDDGSFYKAALLSGPPGIGKTTTATLVCQELGYDTVEFNASDTRSKRLLKDEVAELLCNKSLYGYFHSNTGNCDNSNTVVTHKHVLIMDEVDGMAGNEDRGGIQELISLIKNARVPIICMCNDRNHQKMRSLVNYCYDLRFNRPRIEQIKGAMMSICFKEQIKLPKGSLEEIIAATNNDIRQTLNYLALHSANRSLSIEMQNKNASSAKKDLKIGPWDVVRKVFSLDEHKGMSMTDKSDLFFNDYSLGPLFVQQNYLIVTPKCPRDEIPTRVAQTADCLSLGDLVERRIRSQMAWSMLPLQAMYSSVMPGEYMAGNFCSQINFPGWLGKNSKSNKRSRLAQELHDHTRIRTSGSRGSIRLDYAPFLLKSIVKPLKDKGLDGVQDALEILKEYRLLREDIDSLIELSTWPGKKSEWESVDSKVKAALTRAYNKEVTPYSYTATAAIKKKKSLSNDDGGELGHENEEDGDAGGVDSDNENDNVDDDVMIKAKKKPVTSGATKKGESSSSAAGKKAGISRGKGSAAGKSKK